MVKHRISYQKVNTLCNNLKNFRLVKHQWLGKNDYFYNYSLVIDDNRGQYIKTILNKTSLKAIYDWLLDNAIEYKNNIKN